MKTNAIIFDIDGTAIDSPTQKIPSDHLIKTVNRLKDSYYLSAATGRVWTFAKSVLQSLALEDPCIISAGTQICNPKTGEILWEKTLSESALEQAIGILRNYPYKILHNDYPEDDYFHGGVLGENFSHTDPVYFLEQVFIPDDLAIQIRDQLNTIEGVTCVMVIAQKPGTRDLHIINKDATKEHAIAQLLSMLNVDKENTIGIGDGHNDIHLFSAVNYKVAMGNAAPELKELADIVINPVNQDGMAMYLETLLK